MTTCQLGNPGEREDILFPVNTLHIQQSAHLLNFPSFWGILFAFSNPLLNFRNNSLTYWIVFWYIIFCSIFLNTSVFFLY